MRVLGRRSLSGQVPPGAELAYDSFYPIYDSRLELQRPQERPTEFSALEWSWRDEQAQRWLQGEQAADWSHYPDSMQGYQIIGERSWFIRPEWTWPREERRRGLVVGPLEPGAESRCLDSDRELTYEYYLKGIAQDHGQLIVMNSERQMIGPAYRWAAINSNFARALGWRPSDITPFQWVDCSGSLTVKSVYWKDGWIWLEPPSFDSLGEGWVVLATNEAIKAIRNLAESAEMHLWVERHSHGDEPYEGMWHLFKEL